MKASLTYRDPLLSVDGSIIGFYEREFYMFSNFSSFQVRWKDHLWSTSEHAHQAAKFFETDQAIVATIERASSAHDAYKLAQLHKDARDPDWDAKKADIMHDICRHKLQQHPYIQHHLLLTGDEQIVEDSPKDSYWGWGDDHHGRNELGTIWMKLREELHGGKL